MFRLLNRFRFNNVAQAMIALAMLLVAGVFYLISAPVNWYLVAHAVILAGGAQAKVALVLLHRHCAPVKLRSSEVRRSGILRPVVAYAWATNGTSLVNTLRAGLDLLLLAAIFGFGPASAGVYSVVRQITGAINKMSSVLSAATFPEISALAARRDLAAAIALRSRLLRAVHPTATLI